MITFKIAGVCDRGIEKTRNEDRIVIDNNIVEDGYFSSNLESYPVHCAVCDGVGGSSDGSFAAQFIAERLTKERLDYVDDTSEMMSVLEDVNRELFLEQGEFRSVNSKFSTVVGISIFEEKIIYYYAGDSRLYRYREGMLRQLSEDHSIAQEQIDNGIITEDFEQAKMACGSITRCMGDRESLPPECNVIDAPAMNKDLYLLCSDGLWGGVKNSIIEEVLSKDTEVEAKVRELFELAIQNSSDNISIILIETVQEEDIVESEDYSESSMNDAVFEF